MSPSQVLSIKTMNDGLNLKDDPTSPDIPEGATDICQGVDITNTGIIKTAKGYSAHDLGDRIPEAVHLVCHQIVYMNGLRYDICTTENGFFINGQITYQEGEDVGFGGPGAGDSYTLGGRFKAVAIGSNIYILFENRALRYDGSKLYKWGISAPSTAPDITAGTSSDKLLDDFESLATWIANASGCVISADATKKKAGTQSMKVALSGVATGQSWLLWTTPKDFNHFDDYSEVNDGDIIRIWLYTENLERLTRLQVVFDVGDGSFTQDTYSFNTTLTEDEAVANVVPGFGSATADKPQEPSGGAERAIWPTTQDSEAKGKVMVMRGDSYSDAARTDALVTREVIGEERAIFPDQITFKGKTFDAAVMPSSMQFSSKIWSALDIPKRNFFKYGTGGSWASVKGIKIVVSSSNTLDIWFDDAKIVGGGRLTGEYYFMYGHGRCDADGNVLHYGPPARDADGNLNIQGPIEFTRQKIAWGTRTASSDPQVNCCIIYINGGTLNGWWVGHVITDNGTTSGTQIVTESALYKSMISLRNEPAPGGRDLVWWKNRLWIAAPNNDRSQLRCSDISTEGDLVVEGWPARNAVILSESGRELLSLHEINNQLTICGMDGEFSFVLGNPLDLASADKLQTSSKPCRAKDGVMMIGDSLMYPSSDAFVESNGMKAKAVLPEASTIVPFSGMGDSKAVYRNFDGFFYFYNTIYGETIAKVDLFSGKFRLAFHGLYKVDWFTLDKSTGKVYAIINGQLYLFDDGYSALGAELPMKIRSKAFGVGKVATWKRITFSHNTGGNYFRARIFIDGVDKGYKSFNSTGRTETSFTFGPISGENFQIQFEGNYSSLGEIYLPLKVYVDG